MGVRILVGRYDVTQHKACMVDSVTDHAFGPLFDSEDDVQAFIDWLSDKHGQDPRNLDDRALEARVSHFQQLRQRT